MLPLSSQVLSILRLSTNRFGTLRIRIVGLVNDTSANQAPVAKMVPTLQGNDEPLQRPPGTSSAGIALAALDGKDESVNDGFGNPLGPTQEQWKHLQAINAALEQQVRDNTVELQSAYQEYKRAAADAERSREQAERAN